MTNDDYKVVDTAQYIVAVNYDAETNTHCVVRVKDDHKLYGWHGNGEDKVESDGTFFVFKRINSFQLKQHLKGNRRLTYYIAYVGDASNSKWFCNALRIAYRATDSDIHDWSQIAVRNNSDIE